MALSLTPGPLDHEASERLELPAYHAEFRKRFERARECWRLDRGQVFAVPGDESWEAFRRGDWEESLRLISGRRAELAEDRRRNDARGMTIRRVRVVALPPGPYVQWELRLLLLRYEHGQPARVLLDRDITGVEELTRLPEISTLDT
ncbi:MAG: hypothetical protein J2P26_11545, partial [Nocardiopsaceae bacterium]|nr:hypothetical protein [Nocardiopsaceae bacterium]